jgi:hypothetical protein
MAGRRSRIRAVGGGVLEQRAEQVVAAVEVGQGSPTTRWMPRCRARVWTTAIVCGWQSASTKKACPFERLTRRAMAIASAAAVASSSRDALANSRPVRSMTTCW